MPIDEVNVVRLCKECSAEIETIKVKKDNMRLFSDELIWCPIVRPKDQKFGILPDGGSQSSKSRPAIPN